MISDREASLLFKIVLIDEALENLPVNVLLLCCVFFLFIAMEVNEAFSFSIALRYSIAKIVFGSFSEKDDCGICSASIFSTAAA